MNHEPNRHHMIWLRLINKNDNYENIFSCFIFFTRNTHEIGACYLICPRIFHMKRKKLINNQFNIIITCVSVRSYLVMCLIQRECTLIVLIDYINRWNNWESVCFWLIDVETVKNFLTKLFLWIYESQVIANAT